MNTCTCLGFVRVARQQLAILYYGETTYNINLYCAE